jgi:Fic family protein
MAIHYDSARLDVVDIFRDEEVVELRQHAEAHPFSKLIGSPRWKEESAIDFAYTSAQLEGNTYTRADTILLLKAGRTAGSKAFAEAQMIVNLREAYEMCLDRAASIVSDPLAGIRLIHKMLMRGMLPDDQLGATRTTKNALIEGSEYIPPGDVAYLEEEVAKLFSNLAKAADPFSASVYASCNLSYLQLFEDGNKRTSRLFQNAILVASDLPPVQFPVSMNGAYIEAQLGYYERGEYAMHRRFVLEAYRTAYPLDLR